jgi:hypothetical protein
MASKLCAACRSIPDSFWTTYPPGYRPPSPGQWPTHAWHTFRYLEENSKTCPLCSIILVGFQHGIALWQSVLPGKDESLRLSIDAESLYVESDLALLIRESRNEASAKLTYYTVPKVWRKYAFGHTDSTLTKLSRRRYTPYEYRRSHRQ